MLLHLLTGFGGHVGTSKGLNEDKLLVEEYSKEIERICHHSASCNDEVRAFFNPDDQGARRVHDHLWNHEFVFQIRLLHEIFGAWRLKLRFLCDEKTFVFFSQWEQFLELLPVPPGGGDKTKTGFSFMNHLTYFP